MFFFILIYVYINFANVPKKCEICAILDISTTDQWNSDSVCHMTRSANHFVIQLQFKLRGYIGVRLLVRRPVSQKAH